ncbi:unnamed protein product [Arabidopsis thaliana]|uniref:Uncharacterized protein n=2 Tax=Arabidopsis thaliana TaxID=3702 RepID=A0A1I9LQW7_ARATH|nr:uncharacterized protein AT3G62615 [Arabidopsis thaliana]ANM64975.1 hypothetical protein AT3G62615 [Arabidopsis thaliana]VYS61214.1 unnamed protein product [Arabidopsis thaliana]|eukprot:NP_001326975.1 hypothetical protein AT3G62615 [Arabidopsis thaliana]
MSLLFALKELGLPGSQSGMQFNNDVLFFGSYVSSLDV